MIDKDTAEYVAKKVFDRFKKQPMDRDELASMLLELINNPPYVEARNEFVQALQACRDGHDFSELVDPMFAILWKLHLVYANSENMVLSFNEYTYLKRLLKEDNRG